MVIGIGNILLKDDGVGVHLINALQKENLPSTILLVDGGTSTLDMLGYF
ncbi:MAG TPA: hydrogenase maturation protease, partial [Bacillota bacterium]|nr:hydrogenase maturation protease [Bacillota bacterium]